VRKGQGTIHVLTFKDGILARAAHDLQLRLQRFEVALDGERVTADLDLRSLAVEGPVEGGAVRRDRYDAPTRAEVERAMHGEVLHTGRHPVARFTGHARPQGEGFAVEGQLDLAGRTAPLAFDVRGDGGTYRAAFELRPSRWGIPQYRALLGAIRVQDRVRILLALQDEA
jgi:hypothetical protein